MLRTIIVFILIVFAFGTLKAKQLECKLLSKTDGPSLLILLDQGILYGAKLSTSQDGFLPALSQQRKDRLVEVTLYDGSLLIIEPSVFENKPANVSINNRENYFCPF